MILLSRVNILTRDIDIANLSICPSVRQSVCSSVRKVPVSDENGLTYRHSFFHLCLYFVFYTHCFLVCLLHYVCDFIYTCVLSPVLLVLALSRS